jgi:polysaccharide biosynthesis/export protein
MQPLSFNRSPGPLLAVVVVCIASIIGGCAARTYRASKLPPELIAPASLDLAAVDLSGLANHSVSVEVIQPGDVLEVSMINDYSKLIATTTPVRVGDDGTVVVPLVGKIGVGGMEVEEAEKTINAQSITRGVFRNPCITVTMKQCRTRKVTVVGAVNSPGPHELPRGSSSLMSALLAAGGLSKDAGTDVEIHHTDSRHVAAGGLPGDQTVNAADPSASLASYQQSASPGVLTLDLKAAEAGAIQVPDLRDGDVVHVKKRTLKPFYVMGLVVKPGQFEYPPDKEVRLLDALALAGGVSNAVAEDIVVIRKMPGAAEPARIAVSLQAAKNGSDNLALAPGDTVSVERTPATAFLDALQTVAHIGFGVSIPWFQ